MPFFLDTRNRLVSWLVQIGQTRREIMLASLLLVVLLFAGGLGYHLLEGWPLFEGVYQAFITVTTIGFGEIGALSPSGRLLTVAIGLIGIGLATFVISRFAQLMLASQRLEKRHIMERIERLNDHYIICGFGRIGRRLAEDLAASDTPFVIVDQDEDVVEYLLEHNILHIEGDAKNEETLEQAGIYRARGLITALPEDSSNVFVTLSAREMCPDLFILARTVDHENRTKLRHAGADKVIAPSEVGADRMAQVILRPNVDQFMEQVLRTGALGLQIEEAQVHPGAPVAGATLAESTFRQQFDAVVIGIIDAETNEMKFHPGPETRIQVGDTLIVIGNPEMIHRLRTEGCNAA